MNAVSKFQNLPASEGGHIPPQTPPPARKRAIGANAPPGSSPTLPPRTVRAGYAPAFVCGQNAPSCYRLNQGRSQPHSPGWARVLLSSFFPQILINFSSNFSYFLPNFGPPGGRLAHPGRPWLRHWLKLISS